MTQELRHPSCLLEHLSSRSMPPPCRAGWLPPCDTGVAYPTPQGSWVFSVTGRRALFDHGDVRLSSYAATPTYAVRAEEEF